MEKRAIIFIVASMAVLLAYQYLYVNPQQIKYSKAQETTVAPAKPAAAVNAPSGTAATPDPSGMAAPASQAAPAAAAQAVTNTPAAARIIKIETDLYSASLNTKGGTLAAFNLKKYTDKSGKPISILSPTGPIGALSIGSSQDFAAGQYDFSLVEGGDVSLDESKTEARIVLAYRASGVSITRSYTFRQGSYGFDLVDKVQGMPEYRITLGTDFGLNERTAPYNHVGPVVLAGAEREEYDAGDLDTPVFLTGSLKWAAMEDKYFFAALMPRSGVERADIWNAAKDMPSVGLTAKGEEHSFLVYAGPKSRPQLMELGLGLEHIVDFGFFSIIALPIFWLLLACYSLVGNFGWAIVLVTVLIRIPFIPLVNSSQRSMKKLAELQPRVKELQERMKGSPDKLNTEMMALYRKHKVNPLGGCLPLLLQIPVFFALYKVLIVAIEMREAPFMLWVTDLSAKDPYYVLPILMGITMFIQQKMTPSTADPMQQKIFLFMPIIFTFMFLSFPSGLVVYWLMSNLLSIAQQFYINRTSPKPAEA